MSTLSYHTNAFFTFPWITASLLCSRTLALLFLCSLFVRLSAQKHEGQLSVMQLMDMLTGVASGMKYLTEMGFVHKRLAAHKVRTAGMDDVGGPLRVLCRLDVHNGRKKLLFGAASYGNTEHKHRGSILSVTVLDSTSLLSISGARQLQPGLQGVWLQTPSGGQDWGYLHHTGESSLETLIDWQESCWIHLNKLKIMTLISIIKHINHGCN